MSRPDEDSAIRSATMISFGRGCWSYQNWPVNLLDAWCGVPTSCNSYATIRNKGWLVRFACYSCDQCVPKIYRWNFPKSLVHRSLPPMGVSMPSFPWLRLYCLKPRQRSRLSPREVPRRDACTSTVVALLASRGDSLLSLYSASINRLQLRFEPVSITLFQSNVTSLPINRFADFSL